MREYVFVFIVGALCGAGAVSYLRGVPDGVNCAQSPLVIANCRKLSPLKENDFGATTLKLRECGEQYNVCRSACVGGEK